MKARALIFARVSSTTSRQDYQRQVNQLKAEAERRGWRVADVYAIKESATKKHREQRKAFQDLLGLIQSGKYDKLLCKEVTRVGRKMADNVLILEACNKAKVSILAVDQGTETLSDDGSPSMAGQLIFSMFSSIAEADSRQHKERIMSGLQEARRQGKSLGRPSGSTESDKQFLSKYKHVQEALTKKLSIRQAAKLCDVSPNTVVKVKKLMTA